jgi:hypothetical protein
LLKPCVWNRKRIAAGPKNDITQIPQHTLTQRKFYDKQLTSQMIKKLFALDVPPFDELLENVTLQSLREIPISQQQSVSIHYSTVAGNCKYF